VLFAAIFKVLPDVEISWSEVWIGAGVTALLFEIGKFALGIYLGREGTASPYGAAGSAVLLLLWVYYASLILLFGAEFTQVYAQARGARIQPSPNAEPVTREARAQQGLEPSSEPLHGDAASFSASPTPARETLTRTFGERIGGLEEDRAAAGAAAKKIALEALGAFAGGFAIGLLARRSDSVPVRTPVEEIKHGSGALAAAGAAAAAAFLSKVWSRSSEAAKKSANKVESRTSAIHGAFKRALAGLAD
jgi:membrane protein